MATFTSNSYEGRYLQLTITESVDVILNQSYLIWSLKSTGGEANYYDVAKTTVQIDGTTVYSCGLTTWDTKAFPAAKGSVNGIVAVPHLADGSRRGVQIVFDTRVYYHTTKSYGGTIDLTQIDRHAPNVSISLSNVTESSVMVTATTDVTADVWDYTIDNGTSWVTMSTQAGNYLSYNITGLSPNTGYNVYVRARKQTNQVYGVSAASYLKTYGNSLLNSVNTVDIDAATPIITMNWTVYSDYTHILVIKDRTTMSVVSIIRDLTCSVGTNNKTITLTNEQRSTILRHMKNVQSFEATFELLTFSGDQQLGGSSVKTATIRTTASVSAPTFTDFTHRDSNVDKTVVITGDDQLYIKGYSLLQIDVGDVSAKNEADIVGYNVTVGSDIKPFTSAPFEYGAVGVVGENVTLMVEVVDSRGYSTTISKTIMVVDYADVSITDYTIRRKNEVEPTVQLTFSGDISPIKIDESRNEVVSAKFRYMPNGGSWSGWNNLDVVATDQDFTFATTALSNSSGVLEFDPNSQYTIDIKVTDRLSSDTMTIILNKGTPLVSFRSKKVGINEPNPTAALHIRGEGVLLKLNDLTIQELIRESMYPVGSIYTSVSATSPNELFGGEWEQIENRFLLACGSEYEAGSIGGEATHALTIDEMPQHDHNDGTDHTRAFAVSTGGTGTSAVVFSDPQYGTRGTTTAGGNQPHNNMPPYVAVYVWKRIK